MPIDPRVQRLIEELLESGSSAEDVCLDSPDLLPQVREEWRRVRAVRAQIGALFPESGSFADDRARPQPPPSEVLPRITGYEVEALLGQGGMGVVFRARHLGLNRVVALKMALAGAFASPRDRGRFQREAEAVAGLQHPNVVQIHDVGESEGRPFFTMELVEGGSLAQKLAGTPFPAAQAAGLIAILAEAVAVAHRCGIVHRDLKPSNILLTAEGTPKISDFGLARRLDGEAGLTQSGVTVGTPSYMAPEQAPASPLAAEPAVDIYALGAILYEMLTGRPPFRSGSAAETIRQVIGQDPVPPSRLNSGAPRDLETICLKCLHKDPRRRYDGARAVADDVRRFLRGESVAARPEGRIERLARRVRRRPGLSAAVASGALLGATLLIGGLWILAERRAIELAAAEDLRDMARLERESAWHEASAALERARGRLGDRGPAELRRLVARGKSELDLVRRLEAIRMEGAGSSGGVLDLTRSDDKYRAAFREARFARPSVAFDLDAGSIKASHIREAIVDALDVWASGTRDQGLRDRLLAVARDVDIVSTGWRARARDPETWKSKASIADFVANAPFADLSASFLLSLEPHLLPVGADHLPFLKRIQSTHPGDFWANLKLADVFLHAKFEAESIRFYQAALAIRPGAGIVHNNLGIALGHLNRIEDAIVQHQEALRVDPTSVYSHLNLALTLPAAGRYDEAIEQARLCTDFDPRSAGFRRTLGDCLLAKGGATEAVEEYRRSLRLDPKYEPSHLRLRTSLVTLGRLDEARVAWAAGIAASPDNSEIGDGYAELSLFLGSEDGYRRARTELLSRFGKTRDVRLAERVGRACLLMPGTEGEIQAASSLVDFAIADEGKKAPAWTRPYFKFAQGLSLFRLGRLDSAAAILSGEAAGALGPAPGLVLAMVHHRSGREVDANGALQAAIRAFDWSKSPAIDRETWIYHCLRREAERMIAPGSPKPAGRP